MKKMIAYILLSALIFSTMEVVLKIMGAAFDPFQLTFIRFIFGGFFLFPFAYMDMKKRNIKLEKSDYLYLAGLGILCICISMIFFQIGVMKANAFTAAVLFCVNPMFTMIFAHFLTDEKLNKQKIIALSISLTGIVAIINPFHISEGNTVFGMTLTLLAALTFGLYSAIGKRRIAKIGGLAQTAISFLLGAAVLFVFLLMAGKPVISGISMSTLPQLLYLGIVVTGLGYLFYFKAMEEGGAQKAGIVFFLKPVFAPIVAVIVLNEIITLNAYLGIVLILIGSFMNLRKGKGEKVEKIPERNSEGDTEGNPERNSD